MFEPGSARFGNFINYYSFNSSSKRLNILNQQDSPLETFIGPTTKSLYCLDIGCNSGVLTKEIYDDFNKKGFKTKILGVDIDPVLIERSLDLNRENQDLAFQTVDVTNHSEREMIKSYLVEKNISKFDITFMFSVTMWIHINKGDDAFKDFLKYICNISEYILLEPQSWKSYKSVVRRSKRLGSSPFTEFSFLKWREDVTDEICNYLTDDLCNMKIVKNFGKTQWDRSIILFQKNKL